MDEADCWDGCNPHNVYYVKYELCGLRCFGNWRRSNLPSDPLQAGLLDIRQFNDRCMIEQ